MQCFYMDYVPMNTLNKKKSERCSPAISRNILALSYNPLNAGAKIAARPTPLRQKPSFFRFFLLLEYNVKYVNAAGVKIPEVNPLMRRTTNICNGVCNKELLKKTSPFTRKPIDKTFFIPVLSTK